jgi:hypothetical protein
MMRLAQRVKEFFFGKSAAVLAEERAKYIASTARDCGGCGKPATRVFFHTREEWGFGNSRGWDTYACNDETCIQKGRAEKSLRTEEYPWPPSQSAGAC